MSVSRASFTNAYYVDSFGYNEFKMMYGASFEDAVAGILLIIFYYHTQIEYFLNFHYDEITKRYPNCIYLEYLDSLMIFSCDELQQFIYSEIVKNNHHTNKYLMNFIYNIYKAYEHNMKTITTEQLDSVYDLLFKKSKLFFKNYRDCLSENEIRYQFCHGIMTINFKSKEEFKSWYNTLNPVGKYIYRYILKVFVKN